MNLKKNADIASGVLFLGAFLPYVLAILQRKTVPSPTTWAIWGSVDTLAFLAMKKKKALNGQITGAVIGAWTITALAIIFGKPTMGIVEWISVLGAMIGIALWQTTGNAVLAIICSQTATLIGAIPTFYSAYGNPTLEDPLAWTIWLLSCVCALIALKKWDLSHALQPITFTVIETTMVILVVVRPHL